jgi:hypothetical protein
MAVVLRVNVSSKTKRSFVDMQKGCGVCFSIMHRKKVTDDKIRSGATSCVVRSVNGTGLIRIEMQPFVAVRGDYANTSVSCASLTAAL